jgi:hypothetical protein
MRFALKSLSLLVVSAVLASCSSSSSPATYTVGGTVSGLAGSGLVLQNGGGNNLSVSTSGAFTFSAPLASGAAYAVTVLTQPTSPSQTCTVTSGSGTVGSANVTSVSVTCVTSASTVGGTVTGLAGTGLVLQDNGGDNLSISASGAFTFATPVASGGAYAVTVLTQPTSPSQTCTVANGAGTMGAGNVTNVAVNCVTSTYTVGGTIIGLQGTGLVLATAGQANLSVASGATTFTFASPVPSGTSYAVTVTAQPSGPAQTCTVGGGTGTVGAGNVTTVVVNCSTSQFLVGGTVSGLAGTGLVLATAGQADLTVLSSASSFAFGSAVPPGAAYAVTVKTQPASPSQTCTVANGTGTVGSGNVTNIAVTCVTNTYTVGGTVSGLSGTGLVLSTAGQADLAVAASATTFTFGSPAASGSAYAVTVKTQPTSPSQTCAVTTGSGTVAGGNVTSVVVTCTTATFTVGGTVSGLVGSGLVLQDNGTSNLSVSGNGAFTFTTRVASGAAYAVTVLTNPTVPSQTCVVGNGAGSIGSANVTNVTVTCTSSSFTVGGTVAGLATGASLVLQNNGGDNRTVSANGGFTFATSVASGGSYVVTVLTQPTSPSQTCTVTSGSGTVGGGNVTTVAIACSTNSYTVGGTVSGLAGTGLVLATAGQTDLPVAASATSFAFGSAAPSGSAYAVTVKTQPTSPSQTCTVTNGSGTVGGANVTNVAVACVTNTYTVGGTVAGLATGSSFMIRNNGADDLHVDGNGSFVFTTAIASGASYAVTVLAQPANPTQVCTVTGGTGTVGSGNVSTVSISCVTSTFTVGVTVTGLAGTGLVLQNNGADNLSITGNASFTFATPVLSGAAYAVTVSTPPSTPSQNCTVANGSGTVGGANVTNVTVTCATNFTVGGTVSGLDGTGLVLRNNGGNDLAIAADGAFTFTTPVVSGGGYAVTISAQPTTPSQTCTVSGGTGIIGAANVTSVVVSCPPTVFVAQKWAAPAAWGGTANSFWSNTDANLVEHVTFSGAGMTEGKSITWTAPATLPPFNALHGVGSTAATRYSGGPFGASYVATGGDGVLDLTGDMLVCAVVKPSFNPVVDGHEGVIMAKGTQGVDGWVLMQMHESFCFHYQSLNVNEKMAFTETDFSMPYFPASYQGPINPSYVVVCGGRDVAGGQIVVVANGWDSKRTEPIAPGDSMRISPSHATIGGYVTSDPNHDYRGRVYETAVWNIPATRANIAAKMAPILGLFMPDGTTPATYLRDREGYYPGTGAAPAPYHTAWKHQPRIDPAGKGFLIGLQAQNRVPYPEALELWTGNPSIAGAPVVTANVTAPPGDADINNVAHVELPAGSSISVALTAFGNPGFVHGQIWVQQGTVPGRGILTVSSTTPGPVAQGSQPIDLATLAAGWNQVQLTNLTANPTGGLNTLYLKNDGATAIDFYAWGVTLTQLGRDIAGVPGSSVEQLGFNPGPTIYNSLANTAFREVLTLPTITRSTAVDGFCIGANGQPADGMTWQGPYLDRRTLVEWQTGNLLSSDKAKIMVMGTASSHTLRFSVNSGAASGSVDVAVSGTALATNTAAQIKGCVAVNGAMTLYVNDVSVGTGTLGAVTPDLIGGSLSVGSDHPGVEPWQGYVKAAFACRNPGASGIASCQ